MTNSRRLLPLTASVLLLALGSCGDEGSASNAAEPQASTPAKQIFSLPEITPEHGFPAKVKSFNGDAALLTEAPQRIVPGNASLLDALVLLVEPERCAALPSTAFAYSSLKDSEGPWTELPQLAKFEAEPILAATPDLVLIHTYQLGTTVDRVIEHDIPVVSFPVAATWKDLLEGISRMARILGVEERGAEALTSLTARAKALQVPAARSNLRVLPYGNYGSGGSTAGAGTTWQIMIELAGMRNAATEAGLDGHPSIDYEQLLAIDPDFFLIAISEGDAQTSVESILKAEPLLANLRAVREKRFLRLPEALYSTASQRLLDAAELIAEQAETLSASGAE